MFNRAGHRLTVLVVKGKCGSECGYHYGGINGHWIGSVIGIQLPQPPLSTSK